MFRHTKARIFTSWKDAELGKPKTLKMESTALKNEKGFCRSQLLFTRRYCYLIFMIWNTMKDYTRNKKGQKELPAEKTSLEKLPHLWKIKMFSQNLLTIKQLNKHNRPKKGSSLIELSSESVNNIARILI
jgi:hypothetical protein